MNHISEQTLVLFALNAKLTQEQYSNTELHIQECAGCKSLYEDIVDYYKEVEEQQKKLQLANANELATTSNIVPFHTFPLIRSETSITPLEEKRLPIRIARYVVRHPVVTTSASGLAAALVIAVLTFFPKKLITDTNPLFARPLGEFLVAFNKEGDTLWKNHIGPNYDKMDFFAGDKKLLEMVDADGDGRQDVVCGYLQPFGANMRERKRTLSLYNYDGTLRWRHEFNNAIRFGEEEFSEFYVYTSLVAGDFDRDGKTEIITHVENGTSYTSAILSYDANSGTLSGEFWNPGFLKYLDHDSLSTPGTKNIYAGGLNFHYERPALVVFDPQWIQGFGPTTPGNEPPNVPPGTEKVYVLFPRTILHEHPLFSIDYARFIYPKKDGDLEIWVELQFSGGQLYMAYFFDVEMNCTKVEIVERTQIIPNMMKFEPEIEKKIRSREYLEQLRQQVEYWNGEKFVAEPSINKHYAAMAGKNLFP
ncbi:MAG: VCBS repeat-containing protein [Ignavibacteriae bacterium]|nr:VCBS repeat-containing protein [Ignavibacteriota bacterium]